MKKKRRTSITARIIFVVLFITWACLFLHTADRQSAWISSSQRKSRHEHNGVENQSTTTSTTQDHFPSSLLSLNFNDSCASRYQSVLYLKNSPQNPSPYLISKLRTYEQLHKKCGPNTSLYNKSIEHLRTNSKSSDRSECNYLIWTPLGGLGNRMLTLASTFLYAVITERVLLIDRATDDFVDLFCEPFPGSSWVLPSDFPIEQLDGYDVDSERSYGYLVKNNVISEELEANPKNLPGFVYVHLESTYIWDVYHQLFFCDDSQIVLGKINWLLVRSDNYFLPGLFVLSKFDKELSRMFPSRETVFHHLSRYLFHPSNRVWNLTMDYYRSYVETADKVVGLQIRDFIWSVMSKEDRFNQIMECISNENIVQNSRKTGNLTTHKADSNAILVVSLYKEYFDRLQNYYNESNNHVRQTINVYQPSHEEAQQLKNRSHNEKALAEIYLLSFSDVLVTSAWSTFGYVSYNLAGIKPWILLSSKVSKEVCPPCRRVMTLDPCFHTPPVINCETKRQAKTKISGAHLGQCEDVDEGIKLVD